MELGVVVWGGVGKRINVGEPVIYSFEFFFSNMYYVRLGCSWLVEKRVFTIS
jgi:hypothetical protein